MYIKVIGAVFIFLASVIVAYVLSSKLRQHVLILTAVRRGLRMIHNEFATRLTPIDELCERLENTTEPPFSEFMKKLGEDLKNLPGQEMSTIWNNALGVFDLKGDELSVLQDLGRSIGRFDLDEQLAAISFAEDAFSEFTERAERRRESDSKIRAAGAIAAGVLLIIVLI